VGLVREVVMVGLRECGGCRRLLWCCGGFVIERMQQDVVEKQKVFMAGSVLQTKRPLRSPVRHCGPSAVHEHEGAVMYYHSPRNFVSFLVASTVA
jgi:hypothetical protein